MSGEYYASEEPVNKFYKQFSCSPHTANNRQNISSQSELGIQDLEKHLEIAESRCNVLHDHLDTLKQTYGSNKNNPKTRKLSSLSHHKKEQAEDRFSNVSLTQELICSRSPARQSSNAISTDTTGAAVRTINNILNGITDSVNRLSELHVKVSESPRPKNMGMQDVIGREVVTKSSTAINVDVRLNERKLKECASKPNTRNPTSSTSMLRHALKMDKKSRNVSRQTLHDENDHAKKYYKKFTKSHNYLVELYHNEASQMHHSDSDDGGQQTKKPRTVQQNFHDVPPLAIFSRRQQETADVMRMSSRPETARHGRRVITNNEFFEPLEAPRTEVIGNSKNYELPTVSSKMKQVAKSYLTGLNFKVIPFCPAMSTTPSHNIGINIQQVMNVIKNRQPFQGISLTLAHNIGLAAEKLNNKPFSSLVSRINSKIVTANKCPLSKSTMNYHDLQEMAKGIPEEVIEEADEDNNSDTPEIKTVYITGPSGDVEVKTRNMPTWMADPTKSEQCTCILQPNVDIEKISNKYYRSCRTLTNRSVNSQILNHKRRMLKSRTNDYKNRVQTRTSLYQDNVKTKTAIATSPTREPEENKLCETESIGPSLQGREKNLKLVLTNLHNEFEEINKKYDELCQKSSTDDQNNENVKELEQLETQLSKKEEEITMVMALYKEVLALKQQVKLLKDKKSQPSILLKEQQDTKLKFKEYNNPEAAFHLTKLLRQIQHYQLRYKTNLESAE